LHTFDKHLIRIFDSLPAGAEFIVAPVFLLVLPLVAEILGFTKGYNFTRSVK
jgi:hypothetical protein